ncbi:MAG: hypothetical protein ACLFVP_01325 [Candidatus Bathyarchaeia archaeon]
MSKVNLKTDWQVTHLELMKALHGYELESVDKEEKRVDYITEENGKKKLLRIIVDEDLRQYPGYVDMLNETLEEIEERGIDEATIFAKRFTSSSRRIAKNEDVIEFASNKAKPLYSPVELLLAIQKKVQELCIERCGKVPTSAEECPAYESGELNCPVRRISDDADFHAEQQWIKLLVKDFAKLVELEKEGGEPESAKQEEKPDEKKPQNIRIRAS